MVAWGPLLSGIGSFASGVAGLFGDEGPGPTEQINTSRRMTAANARAHVLGVTQGAKDAGLHPLAALGIPAGGGASISFGQRDNPAQALHDMGQGVSRAVEAYSGREERDMNKALLRLNVQNAELQNQRLASEIRLMDTSATNAMRVHSSIPGQSNGPSKFLSSMPDQGVGVEVIPKEIIHNDGKGIESGVAPFHQWFNLDGVPVRGLSESAAESFEDDFVTKLLSAIMYSAPDYVRGHIRNSWWYKRAKNRPPDYWSWD